MWTHLNANWHSEFDLLYFWISPASMKPWLKIDSILQIYIQKFKKMWLHWFCELLPMNMAQIHEHPCPALQWVKFSFPQMDEVVDAFKHMKPSWFVIF